MTSDLNLTPAEAVRTWLFDRLFALAWIAAPKELRASFNQVLYYGFGVAEGRLCGEETVAREEECCGEDDCQECALYQALAAALAEEA